MRRTFPFLAGGVSRWSRFKASHELRLFPLRSTSQEKWFQDVCLADCTPTLFQPVIVTAPRGYRKTFSALRIASRYQWRYNIKYYAGDLGWEGFERGERLNGVREALFLRGALLVFATGLVVYFDGGKSSPTDYASTVLDSELRAVLCLCALLLVVLWFGSRRRIVILDDHTMFRSYRETQHRLNKIMSVAGLGPKVVVLSANEGLPLCVSDIASTTMVAVQMPHATEREFYAALQRVEWSPSKAIHANDEPDGRPMAFAKLTADELISVQGRLLQHHAFSVRIFGELRDVDFGPLIANPNTKLSRAHLWAICCRIDLECDVALAWADLGCSPTVKVSELGRVFDEPAMVRIKAALRGQSELPRRLLLLAGLLATADATAEFEHIRAAADQLRRLSPPAVNERALRTGYRNSRAVLELMPLYMPLHHSRVEVVNSATCERDFFAPKGDEIVHLQEAIADALKLRKLPDITDSNSNAPLHPNERLQAKGSYKFHATGSTTLGGASFNPPSPRPIAGPVCTSYREDLEAKLSSFAAEKAMFGCYFVQPPNEPPLCIKCKNRIDVHEKRPAFIKGPLCASFREDLEAKLSSFAADESMFGCYFVRDGPYEPPLCINCKNRIDVHRSSNVFFVLKEALLRHFGTKTATPEGFATSTASPEASEGSVSHLTKETSSNDAKPTAAAGQRDDLQSGTNGTKPE